MWFNTTTMNLLSEKAQVLLITRTVLFKCCRNDDYIGGSEHNIVTTLPSENLSSHSFTHLTTSPVVHVRTHACAGCVLPHIRYSNQ